MRRDPRPQNQTPKNLEPPSQFQTTLAKEQSMRIPLSFFLILSPDILQRHVALSTASSSRSPTGSQLVSRLQTCFTADQLLDRVARHLFSSTDPDGSISSLVLVRLSKQLISLDNEQRDTGSAGGSPLLGDIDIDQFGQVVSCLTESNENQNSLIEGTKACAILSRLLYRDCLVEDSLVNPLASFWHERDCAALASGLEPYQLSGLKWTFATFDFIMNEKGDGSVSFPSCLQSAYDDLDLPFAILPGYFSNEQDLSVDSLTSQVQFRVDDIRTESNKVVKERRQTAWEGDASVSPFAYAGKSMPRTAWSPVVRKVRDTLYDRTGQYYDGCLLNLYPNGQSGMRYHIDPDQGDLWDYDTAVVSVGATRRFALRSTPPEPQNRDRQTQPHSFAVFHGDVTHMFGECQQRFQHTVKKADNKKEECARSSLVFKRTFGCSTTPS